MCLYFNYVYEKQLHFVFVDNFRFHAQVVSKDIVPDEQDAIKVCITIHVVFDNDTGIFWPYFYIL